jgi:formylmethanofuran dehydrogenase subunit E
LTEEWIEKHSVNCRICGELVDERDCVTPDDGFGDICPNCIEEAKKQGLIKDEW